MTILLSIILSFGYSLWNWCSSEIVRDTVSSDSEGPENNSLREVLNTLEEDGHLIEKISLFYDPFFSIVLAPDDYIEEALDVITDK